MPRNRVSLCGAALAWVVVFAIAQVSPAASAVEPDWLPLHAGNQWVYEVHRDHTYRPDDNDIDRVFHAGRSVQLAEPADESASGAFKIVDTTSLRPTQGGGKPEAATTTRVLSFDGGLRMLSSAATRADGTSNEAVFRPPLRMLATTTIGESWKVGTYREGDLTIDLQGEVVGAEKLDPPCPNCLKVRYRGPVSGSVPIYQGSAAIESGRFERVVWMQRGVGIVREVATVESDLRLPEGAHAKILMETTLRLVEHRVAK